MSDPGPLPKSVQILLQNAMKYPETYSDLFHPACSDDAKLKFSLDLKHIKGLEAQSPSYPFTKLGQSMPSIKGIHLGVSRIQGKLPGKHPLGPKFFVIPTQDIFQDDTGSRKALFLFDLAAKPIGNNKHNLAILMVLVDRNSSEYHEIQERGMLELDLFSNEFLNLVSQEGDKIRVASNYQRQSEVGILYTYIDVFHVGDLSFRTKNLYKKVDVSNPVTIQPNLTQNITNSNYQQTKVEYQSNQDFNMFVIPEPKPIHSNSQSKDPSARLDKRSAPNSSEEDPLPVKQHHNNNGSHTAAHSQYSRKSNSTQRSNDVSVKEEAKYVDNASQSNIQSKRSRNYEEDKSDHEDFSSIHSEGSLVPFEIGIIPPPYSCNVSDVYPEPRQVPNRNNMSERNHEQIIHNMIQYFTNNLKNELQSGTVDQSKLLYSLKQLEDVNYLSSMIKRP